MLRKKEYWSDPEKARAASRAWGRANREKVSATHKRYRARNLESIRQHDRDRNKPRSAPRDIAQFRSQIKREYGMTFEEYNAKLQAQGGLCAICRQPERVLARGGKRVRRLGVDHDHVTKKNRELLCHACNCWIGLLTAEQLRRAAEYLDRHAVLEVSS